MINFLKQMFTKPTVMWTVLEELVFIGLFFGVLIVGAVIVYLIALLIQKIRRGK